MIVEYVEVDATDLREYSGDLVSSALTDARAYGEMVALERQLGDLLYEESLAIEAIEREMWAMHQAMSGERRFSLARLEGGLRRWFVEPIARRPKTFLCLALGAVALGAWLWRVGAFSGEGDDGDEEVREELRCPICLDREVSAAKGLAFGERYFVELCCSCGATCCADCARDVASHATRDFTAPQCALCRADLAAAPQVRYLKLKHLLEKRPEGAHVAQAHYELGSMRARGCGCCVDKAVAAAHLETAARAGHGRAAYALAACYAEAKGVAQNDLAAASWLSKAAARGCRDAVDAATQARNAGVAVVACYDAWTVTDGYASSALDLWHPSHLGPPDDFDFHEDEYDDFARVSESDLRAARDAFQAYVDESIPDDADDDEAAARRTTITSVTALFEQVDSLLTNLSRQASDLRGH